MKRFGTLVFAVVLGFLALSLFGCGKREIDAGKLSGNVYKNGYFDLTVTFPDDVKVVAGAPGQAGGEQGGAPARLNLFSVYLYSDDNGVAYNPNIVCMAERIDKEHGVVTGLDYHTHNRRIIESMSVPVAFSREIISQPLGGRAFDFMTVEIPLAGFSVRQQLYARRIGDYILVFAASYTNDDEKKRLEGILRTVELD